MSKKNNALPDPARFGLKTFADVLSIRNPIIGEEPGSFSVFHAGMMLSLAPVTPYECVIVENLINIEWELLQNRRMREAGMRAAIQESFTAAVSKCLKLVDEVLVDALYDKHIAGGGTEESWEGLPFDPDAAWDRVNDLVQRAMSRDTVVQQAAYQEITDLGLTPLDLMAEAYRSETNSITVHDHKMQALERRRREVKQDFDLLQRSRPIEARISEAEVIEVIPGKGSRT